MAMLVVNDKAGTFVFFCFLFNLLQHAAYCYLWEVQYIYM
jgi:hypothetical protein